MSPKPIAALRHAIEAQAHSLGFDLFGVTTPDAPPHYDVFRRWLASGRHAEMGYLASERSLQRRGDPRLILPECRSIIVLGVRYASPGEPAQQGGGGKVAAYAWGADYHEALAPRLEALADFIQRQAGAHLACRWYTDTGPILERELAQRAGLGWIGKNTCLINPSIGSYLLLAELLLGLELPPDPPFSFDRCGACTRCIQTCPTSCILPNRTIDAQRCLSYLTIELKGSIPASLRPQLGGWVFGCDICQQVCPWNQRFASPVGSPILPPRLELAHPILAEELALTPEQFNRKFEDSPVKRTKRRGYLRNVAVALGNHVDPAALPALIHTLQNEAEPLVRQHAAWALSRFGGDAARLALLQAAQCETDAGVLAEIRRLLN